MHSVISSSSSSEIDGERLLRIEEDQEEIKELRAKIRKLQRGLKCAHPCTNPPKEAEDALEYLQQRLADMESGEPDETHFIKAQIFLKLKRRPSLFDHLLVMAKRFHHTAEHGSEAEQHEAEHEPARHITTRIMAMGLSPVHDQHDQHPRWRIHHVAHGIIHIPRGHSAMMNRLALLEAVSASNKHAPAHLRHLKL